MARIPQDQLDRLKREIDLVELVRSYGVELAERGKDLVGLCPFHEESEPSFRVSPSKNLFHCFGCDAKGSVIDFVMRSEGVTFRHAVEILRAGRPLSPPPADRPPPKKSSTVKLDPIVTEDAGDNDLRAQVLDYYHETLKRSPEALAYLSSRGLDPETVVEPFRLGFSNRTLGYHLPQKNRKTGKTIRGRLSELGIIKTTGHELLRGSLVIPLFDAEGHVVQLYGRKITPNLRSGTPKHLYLPGPFRGIFNLAALRDSQEIILCESLIDALTFWNAGFPNVTSTFGTGGFTDELFQALKSYGARRILIAYDRDDAGDTAAATLAQRLAAEGIAAYRVHFPHQMDANEYALKVTPAEQSLGVVLRAAEHLAGPIEPLTVAEEQLSVAEEQLSVVGCQLSEETPPPSEGPSLVEAPPPVAEKCEPLDAGGDAPDPENLLTLAAQSSPPSTPETQAPPASSAPRSPTPDRPTTENGQPTTENSAPENPTTDPRQPSVEIKDHEIIITFADRRWRIRGLARNLSHEQLRINLLVAKGDRFHVDNLDLYSARLRTVFLKQAASELQVKQDILSGDLGRVLLKLEEIQNRRIEEALEPEDTTVKISDDDRKAALELLKDPRLLERVSSDLEACGLVGEHTNKLVAYLAAVSRKLAKPLAIIVQSSSAAGKSALMEAVLAFMPAEEKVQYSAMTGQSLFYMGETDLKHKILAIAEEEGAQRAGYALKLLQSEGRLSIASTGKDPASGRLVTHEYHVEGPAAIVLTTTTIDLDEELQNRCIVLTVDESREQTRAIHALQREARTLEGLERRLARQDALTLHQNAQRLLKPLYVVNPFARRLTFLDDTARTRRDHEKYLGIIDALALVHQHQRAVKSGVVCGRRVDYVEATLDDIRLANRLASEVLGRTLDELPPQSRRFLGLVYSLVAARCEAEKIDAADVRFSRRDLLEYTRWTYPQVRKHLDRLVEHEYILIHRGSRGQSFVYELLWQGEGEDGERFVIGLIPVEKLEKGEATTSTLTPSETTLTPSTPDFDPSLTPHCPPFDPRLTPGENPTPTGVFPRNPGKSPKNAHLDPQSEERIVAASPSYQKVK